MSSSKNPRAVNYTCNSAGRCSAMEPIAPLILTPWAPFARNFSNTIVQAKCLMIPYIACAATIYTTNSQLLEPGKLEIRDYEDMKSLPSLLEEGLRRQAFSLR